MNDSTGGGASWVTDRPFTSPFARPAGRRGRLAGRLMLIINKQSEVLALLDPPPDGRVLEVGFGPGGLIRQLTKRTRATVCGVDPSPDMVALAGRVNRSAVAAGRVELRVGTAARTTHPDATFDRVVSVNNVAIWPDLEAGLTELHRVVRPGGVVLISWHGGTHPSRRVRGLLLREERLDQLRSGLADLFGTVGRHELSTQVAFRAVR